MSVIERSIYVAVGAVDLAAEKMRELPSVERLRERTLFEQVRDIEPKLRKQADELQSRGARRLRRARGRVSDVRSDLRKRARAVGKDAGRWIERLSRRAPTAPARATERTKPEAPKSRAKAS